MTPAHPRDAAPRADAVALEVDGAVIRAGERVLVRGAGLRLPRGQTLGVVGESGSGKTVLFRTLLGLNHLEPGLTRGSARFDLGVDGSAELAAPSTPRGIRRALARLRPGAIGVVFQDPRGALDPFDTVSRHLAEAAPGEERTWLERLHIRDPDAVMRRYPHELSGGMAQRVMLALALATRPSLLVADEPTTGLDAHLRVEVVDLLRGEALAERRTAVVVSHDLEVIARTSDRVAVMLSGLLLEEGPAAGVLAGSTPGQPYTRWLVERARELREGRLPAPGSLPPPAGDLGCPFRPRCPVVSGDGSLGRTCEREVPSPVEIGEGHRIACHALARDGA